MYYKILPEKSKYTTPLLTCYQNTTRGLTPRNNLVGKMPEFDCQRGRNGLEPWGWYEAKQEMRIKKMTSLIQVGMCKKFETEF